MDDEDATDPTIDDPEAGVDVRLKNGNRLQTSSRIRLRVESRIEVSEEERVVGAVRCAAEGAANIGLCEGLEETSGAGVVPDESESRSAKLISYESIDSRSFSWDDPVYGVLPNASSKAIIPRDQMSTRSPYFPVAISGAIVRGVPTIERAMSADFSSREKPRSANLTIGGWKGNELGSNDDGSAASLSRNKFRSASVGGGALEETSKLQTHVRPRAEQAQSRT